jgi:hypothetical protein
LLAALAREQGEVVLPELALAAPQGEGRYLARWVEGQGVLCPLGGGLPPRALSTASNFRHHEDRERGQRYCDRLNV